MGKDVTEYIYNRVLIPVPLILKSRTFGGVSSLLKNKTYLEDSDIDIKMTREIDDTIMRMLINESAHEIILIWNNKAIEKQVMEEFPPKDSEKCGPNQSTLPIFPPIFFFF